MLSSMARKAARWEQGAGTPPAHLPASWHPGPASQLPLVLTQQLSPVWVSQGNALLLLTLVHQYLGGGYKAGGSPHWVFCCINPVQQTLVRSVTVLASGASGWSRGRSGGYETSTPPAPCCRVDSEWTRWVWATKHCTGKQVCMHQYLLH